MPLPAESDVHVNGPLTNMSVAYIQNASNFIASRVFPNIPVTKQSDAYYSYDRGYFNKDEAAVRAPSTESKGGGYAIDANSSYYCKVYAFHKDIDDQVRSNADSVLQLDREATEYVTKKMLIRKEKDWATSYFATGIWTTDIAGVSGTPTTGEAKQWNDAASTPIEDVTAGKTVVMQSTGFDPNTLVIGREVWDQLKNHPDIIDRVKAGQTPNGPAMGLLQSVAMIMELERILVMQSIENTAEEGATNSHAFIGGKKALLCYSAPTPGIMTPSAGYTFSWAGMNGAGNDGMRIKRFRREAIESDRVEGQMAFDQKLISADLGYFFNDIVA